MTDLPSAQAMRKVALGARHSQRPVGVFDVPTCTTLFFTERRRPVRFEPSRASGESSETRGDRLTRDDPVGTS
jgi:hypothetical protein